MKGRRLGSRHKGTAAKLIGPGSKYVKVRSRRGVKYVERGVALSGRVLATSMVNGKVSIGVSSKALWELVDQERRTTEVENKMLMQRLRVATGK